LLLYFGQARNPAGFSLDNVTATSLAAVVIGQQITLAPNVKSAFFLLFLFAGGCGIGPQFFQGLAREGPPHSDCNCVILL
jgi:putative transport protein